MAFVMLKKIFVKLLKLTDASQIQRISYRQDINILRAGMIVGEADPKNVSNKDLANMMVGRPVNLSLDRQKNHTALTNKLLALANVWQLNETLDVPDLIQQALRKMRYDMLQSNTSISPNPS